MKYTKLNRPICLLCFLTLASCGSGYKENEEIQEAVNNGRYSASIKPLNLKMGKFSGWLNLSVSENQFWARVKINGPASEQMHAQYIHKNGACPDMKDDTNHDGYLDFMEVYRVAGPILIPLDGNLNSQMKGLFDFPTFKKKSSFYYYSEACFSDRLMADLRRSDEYHADMMTKLRASEKLNLTKRVVIIYGTKFDRNLPDSVSTFDGYPNQASIPIACGEINDSETDYVD